MQPDDEVCYCFHVSLRKVENFCRNTKPTYPSQISECLSAGTGCGWCVPLIKKIHQRECGAKLPWWRQEQGTEAKETTSASEYGSAEEYAAARQAYIAGKKQAK